MIDKENAKLQIKHLVDTCDKVVKEGRLDEYNEEMTKKDFVLPLFEALGWNVYNKPGRNDNVSAEETMGGKRSDYGFRINGIPKFFLEVKKLGAELSKPGYAEQAINYAWHKGCTWAVLTDFDEGVRIFNAEYKPDDSLKRPIIIPREDFIKRFDDLWLLSKEGFEQGLLDKLAEKWGIKTKKTPVGEQLFRDLTVWREKLSKNIHERNKERNLSETDLDEAIQRIIDRLIFIRNCEDRGLEPPTLLPKVREWESKGRGALNDSIKEVYRDFDKSYDGKLFEDHLCDQLEVTNPVLEEVITGLYHTKDRTINYDFSALDADVLGNVYEQYLGHILKKTAKRATVTEKHAKRKEQGIYYTPTYIVDYIVRNTVGKLLEDPNVDVERIRVLDPACGSGSFLIKTFDIINEYYSKTGRDSGQMKFDLRTGLPYTRKVKILHDNIFGVDLDTQAVEITQLNLMLKIAEKRQILPQLQRNIKCGNSLIDDEKVAGNKALKWEVEYPKIMASGGFDVVIGNPPYISNVNLDSKEKEFFSKKYYSAFEQFDILVLFIEKGIQLLKKGGYLGFITSNKFMVSKYGLKLRKFLLENTKIFKLIDVSNLRVFKDAATYPVIIVFQKTKDNEKNKIEVATNITREEDFISKNYPKMVFFQDKFKEPPYTFEIEIGGSDQAIIDKMLKKSIPLKEALDVRKGIETGDNKRFVIDSEKIDSLDSKDKKFLVKLVIGRDAIKRYNVKWGRKFLIYDTDRLKGPREKEIFEREKIITSRTVKRLSFGYDQDGMYVTDTTQLLLQKNKNLNIRYLLALINSKLINFFYAKKFKASHMQGGYFRCFKQYLDQIPIKAHSSHEQQPLIKLVDRMLSLNKRLNEIGDKKTDERQRIEEEIKKTDAEIDELVYQLYGITEEEKRIIEESLK